MKGLKTVVLGVVLVAVGSGAVFAGFERAAYEQTIADREVTTEGTVQETEVWQLPDGNWTYRFDYEYEFDQRAEITDQGLQEVYPHDMVGERSYTNDKRGGKHDTRSEAREAMEDNFEDDGETVIVYVDPFYPREGSLDDATTPMPVLLQYGGSGVLAVGLFLVARMARRVSA